MIYITGANGFVGQNLLNAFKCEIINVVPIARNPVLGFEGKTLQVTNYDSNQDWEIIRNCTTIVHLAGCVPTKENERSGSKLYDEINFRGTQRLVKHAINIGVQNFIYLSTAKVLGDYSDHGQRFTNESRLNPFSKYAKSKALAEEAIIEAASGRGINYYIIRPPIIYGKFCGGFFLKLLKRFVSRDSVWLPNMDASRSVLGVNTLCNFITHLTRGYQIPSGCYNVSDQDDLSPIEVAFRISKYTNTKIVKMPFPSHLMQELTYKYFSSIGLAQKLFLPFKIDSSSTFLETGFKNIFNQDDEFREMVESYISAPWA